MSLIGAYVTTRLLIDETYPLLAIDIRLIFNYILLDNFINNFIFSIIFHRQAVDVNSH